MNEQFEYKIAQADIKGMGLVVTPEKYRAKEMALLNKMGRDGWECYHVKTDEFPALYYMKRKI